MLLNNLYILRLRTNLTSNDVNCTFISAFSASFRWLVKFFVILNESIFWRNDIAEPSISKSYKIKICFYIHIESFLMNLTIKQWLRREKQNF